MRFELICPLWLLILLLLPLFWFPLRKKGWLSALLRSLILLLLALALCQAEVVSTSAGGTLLFLVDRSRSAGAALSEEDLPRQAGVEGKVLYFGDERSSDIGSALSRASSLISPRGGKIVLLSDGWDTGGDLEAGIEVCRSAGIKVDSIPLAASRDDLSLLLSAPRTVSAGEVFQLRILLHAQGIAEGILRLSIDGEELMEETLSLNEGLNTFQLPLSFEEAGTHSLEGEIRGRGDFFIENNSAFHFSRVLARKGLLIISSQPGGESFFHFLEGQGLQVELKAPAELKTQSWELSAYEGIFLLDLSREELSTPQVQALSEYVRVQGGGLALLGGKNSFTLGNYFQSDLEELLPVISRPRLEEDLPELAALMVIDNSSSMWKTTGEYEKLELAEEIALHASAPLRAKDQVGVLIFADRPQWLLPLGAGRSFAQIKEKIMTKGPGGGTNAFLALEEAYAQLEGLGETLKYVIFISDGKSQEGEFSRLVTEARRKGIYTTAVAVGEDADIDFMQQVAELGAGRYAQVNNPAEIPSLIYPPSEEKPEKKVEEGELPLQFTGLAYSIPAHSPPPLKGYLKVQAREQAAVFYQSAERRDPVLAAWPQGQGRVLAWLGDFAGPWTEEWLSWEEFPLFWREMINWVAPLREELPVSVEKEGNSLRLELYSSSSSPPLINLLGPEGQSLRMQGKKVGPSRYEERIGLWGRGTYHLSIYLGEIRYLESFWLPDLELTSMIYSSGNLERISFLTGGKIRPGLDEGIFSDLPQIARRYPLLSWLLLSAALLFLAEFIYRRFIRKIV